MGCPSVTIRSISLRPVSSPTGAAPSRHNLIPLYSAGLCDAVTITPGIDRLPGYVVNAIGGHLAQFEDSSSLARDALDTGLRRCRGKKRGNRARPRSEERR